MIEKKSLPDPITPDSKEFPEEWKYGVLAGVPCFEKHYNYGIVGFA
jgi:hypothetical protein